MSWEPGFTRLVCPSLDDTTISLAACLNRKEGFEVDRMFLGHASSICSAKFSPKIY